MFGSAADTARLIAGLELDDAKFTRGVGRALKSVNRLDKGLGRAGRGFGRLGGGLGKAGLLVGGAVIAGLGASAKAAIDWEEAFQGVVKTVNEADLKKAGLSFEDLADGLRKMAREMPTTHEELAAIAEAAGAMGIAGKDLLPFTKQVAILATTTNVSAEDAAMALGQLTAQIGLVGPSLRDPIGDFQRFAAALVQLGNDGNSTESQILDIEKRAGGFARSAGLAKDAALGWAAAAANIFGDRTEMGGTALGKFFNIALADVGGGGKKLKVWAKIAGTTAKDFKKDFGKDASGALQKFIKGLSKLKGSERLFAIQEIFKKGTGIGKLVNDLANGIGANGGLNDALITAVDAWKKATAAQEEYDKRNATVQSAITRLKNTIKDAAISIGEGMVPALGRAADKLAAFLAKAENVEMLKDIGRDVGKALDSIEWDKLFASAKNFARAFEPALAIVLKLADAISKLPPEVVATGGTALLADRLTGGAISGGVGGIVGGLGESLAKSLAARIPVFGKAFVQPVFVTNMGIGGIGAVGAGAAAGAAGGGLLASLSKLAAGLTTVGLAAIIADAISQPLENIGQEIGTALGIKDLTGAIAGEIGRTLNIDIPPVSQWEWPFGPKNTPTILPEVFGGNGLLGGTAPGAQTPGGADPLRPLLTDAEAERNAATVAAKIEAAKAEQVTAIRDTGSTSATAARGTTGAVTTAQSAITSAIYAARPIITTNVSVTPTSIEKNYTTVNRYGMLNGSAGGGGSTHPDNGHGP